MKKDLKDCKDVNDVLNYIYDFDLDYSITGTRLFISTDLDIYVDASAFLYLTTSALNKLRKTKELIVSKSFEFEKEVYKQYENDSSLKIYRQNLEYLKQANNVTVEEEGIGTTLHQILRHLSEKKKRVLVILGNEILKQKIYLEHLFCDVYDAKQDKYVRYEDQEIELVELSASTNNKTVIPKFDVFPNQKVYGIQTEYGIPKEYILGEQLNSGAESYIFALAEESSKIAKVFKSDEFTHLTKDKVENVTNLYKVRAANNLSWFLKPIDILYLEADRKTVIGYVMPKVPQEAVLLSDLPFMNGLKNMTPEGFDLPYSTLFSYCLQIIRKVLWLQGKGILVTDYNLENFAIVPKEIKTFPLFEDFEIIFFDTDSFSLKSYISKVHSGSRKTRSYDLTKKLDAIEFSEEGLFGLCLSILTLGNTEPLDSKGNFSYPGDSLDWTWDSIPTPIQNLFIAAYNQKTSFSAIDLGECILKVIEDGWHKNLTLYQMFQYPGHVVKIPTPIDRCLGVPRPLSYSKFEVVSPQGKKIQWEMKLVPSSVFTYKIYEINAGKKRKLCVHYEKNKNKYQLAFDEDDGDIWRIELKYYKEDDLADRFYVVMLIESEKYPHRMLTVLADGTYQLAVYKPEKENNYLIEALQKNRSTTNNYAKKVRAKKRWYHKFIWYIIGSVLGCIFIGILILLRIILH